MEMSRTPFTRRKRKKEEYEEIPVIRQVTPPEKHVPEQPDENAITQSKVTPTEGNRDFMLRLNTVKPENIITRETVSHEGIYETVRALAENKQEPPVIRVRQPQQRHPEPEQPHTVSKPAVVQHKKLKDGDYASWANQHNKEKPP